MKKVQALPPLGLDDASIDHDFRRHLGHTLGSVESETLPRELYEALALSVRDRLMERWKATRVEQETSGNKRAYYLSLEFLMGRALGNAMLNLDIEKSVRSALYEYGMSIEDLAEEEADAGLGNGGLGRLAACFLDSCATLSLPVVGYGIRYEYGMFRQEIQDGAQVEEPDHWLRDGYVWEVKRPQDTRHVRFGGRSEFYVDARGASRVRWVCLLYTSPSPRDATLSRMPSSA